MNPTQKVVKNSLWLIIQPLILNIVSIFVIGYIARALGQADYGKFVFAFAFVAMFTPIGNMGLRTITVRSMSEDKDNANVFLGNVLVLRFLLILVAFSLAVFVINLMHYSISTKIVVYIAAVAMLLDTISTTFKDAFQSFEKMQYVAYTNFISGAALTVLSVLVLFIGYRLIGLTLVYMFGSLVGVILGGYFLLKKFIVPDLKIDFAFWKQNLYKGAPIFFPTLVSTIGPKFGIVLLSKIAGDASIGIYGAASNLVEKLIIIPDGICTAIFPTMAATYKNSKNDASHLFQRFFLYLFLLGLPIAVGTTVLAKPIITLIYGTEYQSSALILQILIWWLFLTFLTLFQGWTLLAIHQEIKGALVTFVTTPCHVLLILFLTPYFKEIGVATSALCATVIYLFMRSIIIKKYLCNKFLEKRLLLKVILANVLMGILIFYIREYNLFISIFAGAGIYLLSLIWFRVISVHDLLNLSRIFIKKDI